MDFAALNALENPKFSQVFFPENFADCFTTGFKLLLVLEHSYMYSFHPYLRIKMNFWPEIARKVNQFMSIGKSKVEKWT